MMPRKQSIRSECEFLSPLPHPGAILICSRPTLDQRYPSEPQIPKRPRKKSVLAGLKVLSQAAILTRANLMSQLYNRGSLYIYCLSLHFAIDPRILKSL